MDAAARNCHQHPDLIPEIAIDTSFGSLRDDLEDILHQNPNAQWAANEDDTLRREVEQITQRASENTASYVRRFREAANKAYPAPRNPDQERIVLCLFCKGLHSAGLVLWMLPSIRHHN